MTLRTLNYGNYGIFLIMGNAGCCPSTESLLRIVLTWSARFATAYLYHVCCSRYEPVLYYGYMIMGRVYGVDSSRAMKPLTLAKEWQGWQLIIVVGIIDGAGDLLLKSPSTEDLRLAFKGLLVSGADFTGYLL